MLSQYLLFTVIKEWLVNTSVSADVLKVYSKENMGKKLYLLTYFDSCIWPVCCIE